MRSGDATIDTSQPMPFLEFGRHPQVQNFLKVWTNSPINNAYREKVSVLATKEVADLSGCRRDIGSA